MKKLLIIIQLLLSLNLYSQIHSPKDSLALLEIDTNCDVSDSLNWNIEPNPLNWEGVTWDSVSPKRVIKLEIVRKSLAGVLDITPFDSLALINFNENKIDSLILNNLTNLADVQCTQNKLSYLNISTLSSLTFLDCSYNDITQLDISNTNNYNLQTLDCYYNSLTYLNFSALPNLKQLRIDGSSFKTLAFPENDSLIILSCSMVGLKELDISNLTSLKILHCPNNELTELNLVNQTKLFDLACFSNSLTKLDLSATTSIRFLGCSNNSLTELDVSKQGGLSELSVENNQLKKLKMGKHGMVQYFDCSNNQLTEIDLSGVEDLLGCVVKNNNLPFSSLATGLSALSFTYGPQNIIFEPQSFEGDTTLDYSAEAIINDTATVFVFLKNKEVVETNSTGLYTTSGSGVYRCKMTNPLFPDLMLETAPVTIIKDTKAELLSDCKFSCYPNPADKIITIENNATETLTANIYDIYGRLVLTAPIAIGKNSLNVSNLSKGIYFISANGLGKTIKLYKQ